MSSRQLDHFVSDKPFDPMAVEDLTPEQEGGPGGFFIRTGMEALATDGR